MCAILGALRCYVNLGLGNIFRTYAVERPAHRFVRNGIHHAQLDELTCQ